MTRKEKKSINNKSTKEEDNLTPVAPLEGNSLTQDDIADIMRVLMEFALFFCEVYNNNLNLPNPVFQRIYEQVSRMYERYNPPHTKPKPQHQHRRLDVPNSSNFK